MRLVGRVLGLALLVAGCLLVLSGTTYFLRTGAEQGRYEALREPATPSAPDRSWPDWDSLTAQNPECVAWVRVDGTHVDYPVVAPRDADMGRYLDQDFWGQPSLLGCPFLDHRSGADSTHALVYAHHMAGQATMFSELFDCHSQDRFDCLGTMTWATPGGGVRSLEPLCALSLDRDDPRAQRFSFGSPDDLHAWLQGICECATARREGYRQVCEDTSEVVTLVTCSSMVSGQRERTLVLFTR